MFKRGFATTRNVANTFDRNFKVKNSNNNRTKAWVREGKNKDDYFRDRFAHVHARQKQRQKEREEQGEGEDKVFGKYFGKDYRPQKEEGRFSGGGSYKQRYDRYSGGNDTRNAREARFERRTPRLTLQPWQQYLYGTGTVKAALQAGKRSSNTALYTTEENECSKLAQQKGIKVETRTRADLNNMTRNAVHNNVVLETRQLDIPDIDYLSKSTKSTTEFFINELDLGKSTQTELPVKANKPNAFGIYIDQVTDTHNMGAIIRSAYYLGADFVVFSEKNCCKLTPAVCKTAVGAVDLMPIYNAPHPLQFFEKSVSNGWQLIATMPNPTKNKIEPSQLSNILNDAPCLLVLGSEGYGIRTSLANRANYQVGLTPHHDIGTVDSLNVSVAAALLMSRFFKPNAFD